MNGPNYIILFVFTILSYWAAPISSQACIGDLNVTVNADCGFNLASANINSDVVVKVVVGGITKDDPTIDFSAGEDSGLIPGNCYPYELHYTDGAYCWGQVCIETKILPNFEADCIYTAPSSSSKTVDVIPIGDIYDDKNGNGKKETDEELDNLYVISSLTADSSCQILSFEIINSVKHTSIKHGAPETEHNWQYDSICWWIYENVVGGIVVDSGSTSATEITAGFGTGSYSVSSDSTYLLVLSVKESENLPMFLTEESTEGKISGTLRLSDCVPDCFTWCPSEKIATENGNGDPLMEGILDQLAVQELIESKPCFAGVTNLTEERIITGSVCTPQNVINQSGQTAGQLVRIIHSATFPQHDGAPASKRVVLEQAYLIGQPEMTPPFSNVTKKPPSISCGNDITPWGVYQTLLAENLKLIKYTDDAAAVFQQYKNAAQDAFPHIVNIHDSVEVEITFSGGITHEIVSETKTIKVLKFANSLTGQFYTTSADCPQPDTINDLSCRPTWVKETIIDKGLKEVPLAGSKKKWKIPSIHTFYEKGLCGFTSTYTDLRHPPPCGGGVIIERQWSMINFCLNTTGGEVEQTIVIEDDVPPALEEYADITLNANPWTCSVTVELDEEFAMDECSDITSKSWTADGGADVQDNTVTVWLSEGSVTVTGTANDDCGNFATTSFAINVIDRVPPVAISEDEITATLTGISTTPGDESNQSHSTAKVYLSAIDAGSHDSNCSEDIDLCVIRDDDFQGGQILLPGGVWVSSDIDGTNCEYREFSEPLTIDNKVAYGQVNACRGNQYMEYHTDKFCGEPVAYIVYYVTCDDYVKFCCEDAGQSHKVVLQATDDASNISYSWSNVFVEDKSVSGFGCITDIVLCTEIDLFLDDVPLAPYSSTICPTAFTVEVASSEIEELCGYGQILVKYYAKDDTGNIVDSTTCTFDVEPPTNFGFDPSSIKWPKHYDGGDYDGLNLECDNDDNLVKTSQTIEMPDGFQCATSIVLDEPVWCISNCVLIHSSYEDETIPDDATCGKILRRWTVIDWCTYSPNSLDPQDDTNDVSENFEAVEDWTIGTNCDDCANRTGELSNVYFRYAYTVVKDAQGNDKEVPGFENDGYYTFDQVIKILDTDGPSISADTIFGSISNGNDAKCNEDNCDFSDCTVAVSATVIVTDGCNGIETNAGISLRWQLRNSDNELVIAGFDSPAELGALESGNYKVTWIAQDNCGNSSQSIQDVIVTDGKNPTPVCLQGINTATMNVANGGATIWASDYNIGSFDNCSDISVEFRDNNGDGTASLTFNCDDIAASNDEAFQLKLWVMDEAGNEDFCFVTLKIHDNNNECGDAETGASASISGEVFTNSGNMIERAEVSLNRSSIDMTNVTGNYTFNNNDLNRNYEVAPVKDNDYLNGVTTLDLVMIQKYMLGLADLDQNPYNVIAADVNGNESVSASDLVELRNLILNVTDGLPNNSSWRFVDAAQSFIDYTSPFPFNEYVDIDNLSRNSINNDFIGVKIGDVSGNAIANSLQSGTRNDRSANFIIEDEIVNAGEIVSVGFKVSDMKEITAFQGTFSLEHLELINIVPGTIDLSAENLGQLDASTLTVAWYSQNSVDTDDVLFTLQFKVSRNILLSDALSFNSAFTQAVAYDGTHNEYTLGLALNTGETISTFELFQNEPNPFSGSTVISFTLPNTMKAQLTIFDVTGKVVSLVEGDYRKGLNTISLNRAEINATGLLYFQLESNEFSATRKMILLD